MFRRSDQKKEEQIWGKIKTGRGSKDFTFQSSKTDKIQDSDSKEQENLITVSQNNKAIISKSINELSKENDNSKARGTEIIHFPNTAKCQTAGVDENQNKSPVKSIQNNQPNYLVRMYLYQAGIDENISKTNNEDSDR
jgi:hypothetical protein